MASTTSLHLIGATPAKRLRLPWRLSRIERFSRPVDCRPLLAWQFRRAVAAPSESARLAWWSFS